MRGSFKNPSVSAAKRSRRHEGTAADVVSAEMSSVTPGHTFHASSAKTLKSARYSAGFGAGSQKPYGSFQTSMTFGGSASVDHSSMKRCAHAMRFSGVGGKRS